MHELVRHGALWRIGLLFTAAWLVALVLCACHTVLHLRTKREERQREGAVLEGNQLDKIAGKAAIVKELGALLVM